MELATMGSGKITKLVDLEPSNILMETSTKVIGITTKPMAKECTSTSMGLSMMVSGLKMSSTASGRNTGPTKRCTKVTS